MPLENKILLVEDDKHIALALKIRLKAEGYEIVVVDCCATAIDVANNQLPAVALIDFNLPDGNGIELMRQLLRNASTASIVTMIMTASKRLGLREEALACGAYAYFEKPFKSAELIEVIDTLQLNRFGKAV